MDATTKASVLKRLLSLCLALVLSVSASCAQKSNAPQQNTVAPAPAAQTELSQKGISLKVDVVTPSKGLATNVADLLRDPEYARVLNNLHMLKRGVWTSRGTGVTKELGTAFNSGAQILEMAPYTDSAGTSYLIIQAGSKIYAYNTATQASTEIGTGFATTNVPCIRTYKSDEVYLVNGDAQPYKWDGNLANDFTAITAIPAIASRTLTKPRFIEEYAGRQAFAGFEDFPSTVLFSGFNTYGTFGISTPQSATDAGWIDVPYSLGPITGIHTLRLYSNEYVLLVGCKRGVALITGTDALTFQSIEATREFGIPSNRTWVQVQNDLYFMATDGIRAYGSNSLQSLLNASKSYAVQDLANRINKAAADKAFAFYYPNSHEAHFWVPIDSDTTPKNAIVANFNTADPNSPTDEYDTRAIFSTKDGLTLSCATQVAGVAYCSELAGYLLRMYSGDDYDGAAINWSYVSPLIGANSPAQEASLVKFVILTEGAAQQYTAEAFTVTTMSNGVTRWIPQDSKVLSATGASVSDIGTWKTGGSTTTSYPKFMDFFSKGSGRYWALRLKGSSTSDQIDLVGATSILTVGGWRQ